MSRSIGIESDIDPFPPQTYPTGHVFNSTPLKCLRREEALARFEVTATQQKAKLIGGRAQARGGLLDGLGEIKIVLALETVENWRRVECLTFDRIENIHSRHGRPPDKVVPEREWPNERLSSTKESTKSFAMLAQLLREPG